MQPHQTMTNCSYSKCDYFHGKTFENKSSSGVSAGMPVKSEWKIRWEKKKKKSLLIQQATTTFLQFYNRDPIHWPHIHHSVNCLSVNTNNQKLCATWRVLSETRTMEC